MSIYRIFRLAEYELEATQKHPTVEEWQEHRDYAWQSGYEDGPADLDWSGREAGLLKLWAAGRALMDEEPLDYI